MIMSQLTTCPNDHKFDVEGEVYIGKQGSEYGSQTVYEDISEVEISDTDWICPECGETPDQSERDRVEDAMLEEARYGD